MPINPSFTLAQTDTHVILDVAVPHVRVREPEVVLTDNDTVLHFASPPVYLLVLNFAPHQFKNDQDENYGTASCTEAESSSCTTAAITATFLPAINNGTIRIELEKLQAGMHWENLDFLGRLQLKQKTGPATTLRWLKEVTVAEDSAVEVVGHEDDNGTGAQHEETGGLYGFARIFKGVFTDLARDGLAKEMLEMPWTAADDRVAYSSHLQFVAEDDDDDALDNLSKKSLQWQRRKQRIQLENEKFCLDRYMGDNDGSIEEDYIYQCAVAMNPHWMQHESSASLTEMSFFLEPERIALLSIPYPLLPLSILSLDCSSSQATLLAMGMLDMLFAYVYDHLVTDGDPTVESAWTVSILSASLSWLDDWIDDEDPGDRTVIIKEVVQSSIRRALVYPYIRTFEFAIHVVWKHVTVILRRGLRTILRCLLQLRCILDKSEMFYLGNKLFVDPYLAWLQQQAHPELLETKLFPILADALDEVLSLGDTVEGVERYKDSLGFDLRRTKADDGNKADSIFTSSDDDSDSCSEESSEDEKMSPLNSTCHFATNVVEEERQKSLVKDKSMSVSENLSTELLDLHLGRSPSEKFLILKKELCPRHRAMS